MISSTLSYYDELRGKLEAAIESSRVFHSVRVAILVTQDRLFAIQMLTQVITESDQTLYHFGLSKRLRYNEKKLDWEVTGGESPDPIALLRHASEVNGGVVFLEDCVSLLSDEGGDLRMRMILVQLLSEERKEGLVLIFLEGPSAENRLPSISADQFIKLRVPFPRAEELELIAREVMVTSAHHNGVKPEPEIIKGEASRLATCVVGLPCSAARDALRDAMVSYPEDYDGAYNWLQSHKTSRLRDELAMNVLDTTDGEVPIGAEYVFDWIEMWKDKMRLYGPGRAKGLLFFGPPGTGKTILARHIGRIAGLPVVEFRISALMRSWLGETERLFDRAFSALEAMAPNIVFIDEIEKAFGASSEQDGGTMMRCTGNLLSWLSDNPNPNVIVATANNPSRMGEIGLTMTRSERFDAIFFIDVPNLESRQKMLERWIGNEDMASEIAATTEKFSGADLRSLVKQAKARAEHSDEELTIEMLKSEVESKRNSVIAIYDQFQDLRRFGRMHCLPAGPTD